MPESRRRQHKTPEQIAHTRRQHILWLSLLVLVVYASALGGGFVWTDRDDILQGGHRLTGLADVPVALGEPRGAYRHRDLGGMTDTATGSWQPLVILSNSLSWALWGDCAFCFHLENILLHLLVVIGLYALGRHLLSHRRHGVRISAWSAALFAVHPATVSSVAWIGGRTYLLATLFSVAALAIFTRLQATTSSHRHHVNRWLLGLTLCAFAAMLSHETAYMLPLLALLIAGFESKQRGRRSLTGISPLRLRGLLLFVAALGVILAYRQLVMGGLHANASYPTDSVFDNLGTALRHFWHFVDHALLPSEPVISDAWPITQSWGATEVAALLGFLVITAATLVGLKLGHPSAFGVAWFMLWLVPGVGLFATDHYHSSHTLYIATWGLVFAVTYALFLLWRPIGRQLVPGSEAVIYIPIIIVLGVITGFSNARWWNHSGLFESEIATDPHYMEGRLELAKDALQRGDAGAAMNHALAAIEASRDRSFTGYWSPRDGYLVLGRAQWELGLHNEAAGSFSAALEARPGDAEVLHWLATARLSLGEFAAAEARLQEALRGAAARPEIEADLGVALVGLERYSEALPLLQRAVDGGLGNRRRHRAFALALIDNGDLEAAATQLEAALAGREDAIERARLAWVSWRLGRTDKARSDLNMALQLEEEMSPYVDWVRSQIAQDTPTE